MEPQYFAARFSCGQLTEASLPHGESLRSHAYLFPQGSVNFTLDCTQAIETSEREQTSRECVECYVTINRSRRCPRASSCLPCSRLSRAFPLAHSRKKSTSWSILSPSVSSPSTQASTSKNLSGRTVVSVPIRPFPSARRFLRAAEGNPDFQNHDSHLSRARLAPEDKTC